MNFNSSIVLTMLNMKRFGVELKRTPIKGVIDNPKSENDSLYTKSSIPFQKTPDCSDDGSSNYDYNHNHNYNSVYDIYASNNISSHLSNNVSSHTSNQNNIETNSTDYNDNKIKCNLCNVVNDNTNFIMLSCCNDICHIKCLINKFNIFNNNDTDAEYKEFDENSITPEFFNGLKCLKCNHSLNHEDIFNLYSKYILNNKKFIIEYDKKILSLKDQKKKIDNEIKCLNEYILKLQNERQISQIIMTKTFHLMTS